ncbi:MAG: LiaF transmembrane domain-containing protein [Bellilinea sp.]
MGPKSNRSLFWPIVLIGVGVIWLLGAMGVIPNANFAVLLSLWPIVLIIIGLDILIGRKSAFGGAIVGLLAVALVAFALIAGPSLGLATSGTLKTEALASEIGEAVTADININFSSQPVSMVALGDKTSLLKGEIDYYGTLRYVESGSTSRRITLEQVSSGTWSIPWDPNASWDISLTPYLPIGLTLDGGSGSADLDLSQLRLTAFAIDQGSGSLRLRLPSSTQAYTANIEGGSGSLNLSLPADGDLTVYLDGGSGGINIDIPDGTAVKLEIRDAGSGSVNVPQRLKAVRVNDAGKEGKWETDGFGQAAHKLVIICGDLGSGSFNIH